MSEVMVLGVMAFGPDRVGVLLLKGFRLAGEALNENTGEPCYNELCYVIPDVLVTW